MGIEVGPSTIGGAPDADFCLSSAPKTEPMDHDDTGNTFMYRELMICSHWQVCVERRPFPFTCPCRHPHTASDICCCGECGLEVDARCEPFCNAVFASIIERRRQPVLR